MASCHDAQLMSVRLKPHPPKSSGCNQRLALLRPKHLKMSESNMGWLKPLIQEPKLNFLTIVPQLSSYHTLYGMKEGGIRLRNCWSDRKIAVSTFLTTNIRYFLYGERWRNGTTSTESWCKIELIFCVIFHLFSYLLTSFGGHHQIFLWYTGCSCAL